MNQRSILYSVAAAVLVLSGCTGVGQKNFDGGVYQQHFFGGVLIRQADFPNAQLCAAGMRAAKPDPDNTLACSKTSQQGALPYSGRAINASWALDMPIHYRAKEACLREAKFQDSDVKIVCP